MNGYPPTLLVFISAFVPAGALLLAVAMDHRRRKRTERPPQLEKLLRPPGHSLALRLDDIGDKILSDILLACGSSGIAGAGAAAASALRAANAPGLWLGLAAVLFAGFAGAGALMARRVLRRVKEGSNVRLGLRGEQAVAESLHEVADCGYRIFHDLPAGENWNIDHVAVGARGVFLVETKARRRRASRSGQPEHVVNYDGKVLRFPSGDDPNAVPQAERNARWLAEYLGKRTAEPVTVEPLVVLPGWYVETKGSFPVKAMNASYLAGFLRNQRERIQPSQVQRLIAALDDKCRDVAF